MEFMGHSPAMSDALSLLMKRTVSLQCPMYSRKPVFDFAEELDLPKKSSWTAGNVSVSLEMHICMVSNYAPAD